MDKLDDGFLGEALPTEQKVILSVPEMDTHSSLTSLGENEEDYLRAIWRRLGVGEDGFLDQNQLASVCECIGMERVEEVISQLFEKLDMDKDGRISFGEFLHLFRNGRPGKGESSPYPTHNDGMFKWSDVDSHEHFSSKPHVFQALDTQGNGMATVDSVAEWLDRLGLPHGVQLLQDLGYRAGEALNLHELHASLQDELHNALESGNLAAIATNPSLQLAICLCYQELLLCRQLMEQAMGERDKLKSDLQEANQRASLLAQEVDEHHSKLETSRAQQLKQLENKYAEQLRQIQDSFSAEREQYQLQAQQLSAQLREQLSQSREEELKIRVQTTHLEEEIDRLNTENAQLMETLKDLERSKFLLRVELDGVSRVRDTVAELESRCEALEDKQHQSLLEQVRRLSAENVQLRDRNDELSMDMEFLRAKLASRTTTDQSVIPLQRRGSLSSDDGMEGDVMMESKLVEQQTHVLDKTHARKEAEPNGHNLALQLLWASGAENEGDASDEEENKCARLECQLRLAVEEKQHLWDEYAKEKAALESQVAHLTTRCADLVSLQQVIEAEHDMEISRLQEQKQKKHQELGLSNHNIHQAGWGSACQLVKDHLQNALDALDAASDFRMKEELSFKQLQSYCAELEKKLSLRTTDGEELANPIKMQLLEQQCRTLEGQLDGVKFEIVKILSDKDRFSKENEDLQHELQNLKAAQNSKSLSSEIPEDELERKVEILVDERIGFETALLQKRIRELASKSEEDRKKWQADLNQSQEKCAQLEESLEVIKQEFDRVDDYWQSKLEEERDLSEQERANCDERLRTLEKKIKEYEELLSDTSSDDGRLSTIEERSNLEKQVTETEEENQMLRDRVAALEELADPEEMARLQEANYNLERAVEEFKTKISKEQSLKQESEDKLNAQIENVRLQYRQVQIRLQEALDNHRTEVELIESHHRAELERLKKVTANGHDNPAASASASFNEQMQDTCDSPSSSRPATPTPHLIRQMAFPSGPKAGLLPPNYSPMKSKGWTFNKSPQSLPTTPFKIGSVPAGSGPASFSNAETPQKACRVDLSVLQALNNRLRQQEQRGRELQSALRHQQLRNEQILLETKMQHREEMISLESMMKMAQDALRQQTIKYQDMMEKLTKSDLLILELYTENAHLMRALQNFAPNGHRSAL